MIRNQFRVVLVAATGCTMRIQTQFLKFHDTIKLGQGYMNEETGKANDWDSLGRLRLSSVGWAKTPSAVPISDDNKGSFFVGWASLRVPISGLQTGSQTGSEMGTAQSAFAHPTVTEARVTGRVPVAPYCGRADYLPRSL
uniref:Uncharacterized protein n=1 Tax=Candidatus Kentrum sp. TUN TaxID=2126343 RepID=A0A451AHH6_9GAMM|nr:MAG: hypothetical protein BECKTUN1418D_GA0071000_13432 [Candidatus Kentron sp. TUN]